MYKLLSLRVLSVVGLLPLPFDDIICKLFYPIFLLYILYHRL